MSAITALKNRVFLGNEDNARDIEMLQSYAITHVISLTQSVYHPDKLSYYPINIDDSPIANIYQYFEPCVEFINNALDALATPEGQNILVHCAAGVSRSASIVIAYIMSAQRVDYETALALVRADRHYVCPNEGFVLQLRQWQMALGIPFREPEPYPLPVWHSTNGRVRIYNERGLFLPKEDQPNPAVTQIITRFYMQDGIGGYRVELVNGAPQSAFTGFSFPKVGYATQDIHSKPEQIIICTSRVLLTFIMAKCMRIQGFDFDDVITELQRMRLDTNPYIRQQLEQLITGTSEDLVQERLGLLATYSKYISWHGPNDSDDRLWGIYDLLLKFETWAIPEVNTARDELVFLVANRLGLDSPDDEFEVHEPDVASEEPRTATNTNPESEKMSDTENELDEDI